MRLNSESSEDVTALLLNWQSGDDKDAPAKLMPLVYEELRRVARATCSANAAITPFRRPRSCMKRISVGR